MSHLLVEFDEREAELLGVAKATDVAVEAGEHLSLVRVTWYDALQASQRLGAERLAVAARHGLHELGVRPAELAQEHVDVQTATAVEQVDLHIKQTHTRTHARTHTHTHTHTQP